MGLIKYGSKTLGFFVLRSNLAPLRCERSHKDKLASDRRSEGIWYEYDLVLIVGITVSFS